MRDTTSHTTATLHPLALDTLDALMRDAAGSPEVSTVRASISPDNVASLALVHSLGSRHVGEQWDDDDGLEWIFERPSTI